MLMVYYSTPNFDLVGKVKIGPYKPDSWTRIHWEKLLQGKKLPIWSVPSGK